MAEAAVSEEVARAEVAVPVASSGLCSGSALAPHRKSAYPHPTRSVARLSSDSPQKAGGGRRALRAHRSAHTARSRGRESASRTSLEEFALADSPCLVPTHTVQVAAGVEAALEREGTAAVADAAETPLAAAALPVRIALAQPRPPCTPSSLPPPRHRCTGARGHSLKSSSQNTSSTPPRPGRHTIWDGGSSS